MTFVPKTNDKYYTPCNVSIFINGYKVTDAFRVDWDARDSKTPLYGWADDTFSAVSRGRKIITGRLVINYRTPNYLSYAISEVLTSKSSRKKGVFDDQHAGYTLAPNMDTFPDFYTDEFRSLDTNERVKFLAKISAENYKTDSSNTLYKASKAFEGNSNLTPSPYKNNQTFDIYITYGNSNLDEKFIEVVLKDAYIVGQTQTISASATGGGDMSSSGSPIYEVYSFFAKELVETLKEGYMINSVAPLNQKAINS